MKKTPFPPHFYAFPAAFSVLMLLLAAYVFLPLSCASFGGSASAEEYYTIGMAYYELGKFTEAEQWLNRAKAADRTLTASEYNLGRIAYETGRYKEAAALFEKVLAKDPSNVMALKAAAYTRIKTGELEAAEKLYQRVLQLERDSPDGGYNYALVLYALKKYEAAEELMASNQYALLENKDMLLLYARTQKAQDKVEAADSYAKWLVNNSDPKVRYEYAQVLENAELYARALEEYRASLAGLSQGSADPSRAEIRYTIARLLFTADPENPEGIIELRSAIADGYSDFDAMEKLALDEKISSGRRSEIRTVIDDAKRSAAEREAQRLAAESAALAEQELILSLLPGDVFFSEAPVRLSGGTSLNAAGRAPLVYRNYQENSALSTSALMTIDWRGAAEVSGKDGPYAVKDEELSAQVIAAEFVLGGEKNWTGFQARLENKGAVLERSLTMEVPFRFYDFSDINPSFTLIIQFGVLSDKEKGFVENQSLLVEKQLYPPANAVDPRNPAAFSAASRIGTIEFDAAERRKLREATHLRLILVNGQSRQLSGRVLLGAPAVLKD